MNSLAPAPDSDEPEHVFSVGTHINTYIHVHIHGWPRASSQAETLKHKHHQQTSALHFLAGVGHFIAPDGR